MRKLQAKLKIELGRILGSWLFCLIAFSMVTVVAAQVIGWYNPAFIDSSIRHQWLLYMSVCFAVLACVSAIFYAPRLVRNKTLTRGIVILLIAVAILTVAVTTHALASQNHGWDVSTVDEIARSYVSTGRMAPPGDWNELYLAKYENNIPIVIVLITIYKILGHVFGEHYTLYSQLLNSGSILATFGIILFLAYKLYGLRSFFIAYLFGYVLIILSAYIPVTYTDTLGVVCVSLSLLILYMVTHLKGAGMYISGFCFGLIMYAGYLIKPTVLFIGLAAAVGCLLLFLSKHSHFKVKAILLTIACCVMGIFALYQAYGVVRSAYKGIDNYTIQTLEKNATPLEHFLAMGSFRGLSPYEECVKGSFCDRYVNDVQAAPPSLDTVQERQDYALRLWERNVEVGFPFGYTSHLINKMVLIYNDGSFGVWKEAEAKSQDIEFVRSSNMDTWVRSYMGPNGMYLAKFRAVQHGVWLALLVMIMLGSILAVRRQEHGYFAYVFGISLILITLFLMIFEARARYLFLYVPVFILLAVSQGCAISEWLAAIKDKSYRRR